MGFINDIFSGIEKELLNKIPTSIEDVGKSSSDDFKPGDIHIESLTLMSEDKQRKYDLLAQCKGINIFESLTSPVIFAELEIADSMGLYQSFPIIGEEYVLIKFKTPSSKTSSKYLLRVNKIINKEVKQNNMMMTYTLQLLSVELIRNSTRLMTLSYKDTIDNLIKQITNDGLGTEKPIKVSKTSGIEEGIITKLRPLEAIDFLRRRAVSNEYPSSSFVFYESRDGFVFTTVEELIEKGSKSLEGYSDKEFFFDTNRNINLKDVSFRNILAYNQVSFADTISKAQEGGIANEVNTFDLVTGNVKNLKYKDDGSTSFKQLDKNGAPTNSTSFINKNSNTTSVKQLIPISSDMSTTKRPEKVSLLTAFAQNITQNIIRIHIYGDSEIQVGDVIKCMLPSAVVGESSNKLSRLESGNYLVAKVRHIILNSDRPQHTIALELIKGNYNEVG